MALNTAPNEWTIRALIEHIKSGPQAQVKGGDWEPDNKTASQTFILDLWDERDLIDNGKRLLPMQIAMSLAPDQVRDWLNERPEPDSVIRRPIPVGPTAALARTLHLVRG